MIDLKDMTMVVSMNYFTPEKKYIGTITCLPNKRFQLVLSDETRLMVPEGATYRDAANILAASVSVE